MTARVTQQVLTVTYATSPNARVTAMALEVVRTTDNNPIASTTKPQTIVVVSN